jgi:hypothetical protein
MRMPRFPCPAICLLTFAFSADATILYVDLNCTNSVPPYAGWDTAATNIQDAVDAALTGDQVLVPNGIYQTGSRVSTDGSLNRVVVTNAITLKSVNGPPATDIDGSGTARCVYLADGAVVSGFTLLDGNAAAGGAVRCVSDNATVANCLVISNSATAGGGGLYFGTASNCVIAWNNSQSSGGGADSCTLNNCVLSNNMSGLFGGGAAGGRSALTNCVIWGNSSANNGGGVYGSTLNSCLIISNRAPTAVGGGAYECDLESCTVAGNSASSGGGIAASPSGFMHLAQNCIVYYNSGAGGENFIPPVVLERVLKLGSCDFG